MFFHPSAKLIIYARVWNGMAIKFFPPPDFYVPPPSFRSPLLHGEAGFGLINAESDMSDGGVG